MNVNNRLEMFLTLNADAFRRGLTAAGAGLRNFSSGVSTAATQIATMVAPITALVSAAAGLHKLVDVTREFDKLSAGLITATGSAVESKKAFAAIQDFAARTPYDLAQVTDSFVKLVNFGLNPSERALTSYGNTSSALGKNLNQMIEAVADAATGEFERLKEFGIKTKVEGDKVSFAFRGVTTTIGNNAKEIEDYLIKLGETNFGDAMANRMSTLDGALSNLGDEWDKLFLNISQSGIGDAIADGVRLGIDALEELNAMISSGELLGYLKASACQWAGWAEDIGKSISLVGNYFDGEMNLVQGRGAGVVSFLIDAFRQFPENVRAFIGLVTVVVASEFDKVMVQARAFKDMVKALFNDETIEDVEKRRDEQLKIINEARNQTIDSILKERQVAIESTNAQIEAAKKLRVEYEKNREAEKANKADKLEKYQVQAKAEKTADRQQAKDFNVKSGAKFVQKDGEWVQVPTEEQPKASGADDEKARKEKADYRKELAEKKKQFTPDEFKDRQDHWQSLENERPLTKEEEKEKKAEEAKFKKEEAERIRLEKDAERDAKKEEEKAAKPTEPAKQYRIINGSRFLVGEDEDEQRAVESKPDVPADHDVNEDEDEEPAEKKPKKRISSIIPRKEVLQPPQEETKPPVDTEEADRRKREKQEQADARAEQDSRQAERDRQLAEEEKQREEERAENAKRHEAEIAEAGAKRVEAAKQGAEEVAQAEVQAAEKAKSAFQKYADKVRSLQDDIAGREKSLAEELDGLDNRGTAESKWRKKAKEAKEYEKAAKAAMAAGELDKALSLSDQAKAAYSTLQGGAGSISDKLGDQTAFKGVKSSGLLGIDISKALQQATAKTALTAMPGGDLFGDLSGRIRGQLAAVAGGGPDQGAGKGGAPVEKIHVMKFQGGELRGGEADVEAFLNLLAQAGMSAG